METGFDTPSKFADAIASLDYSVQVLDREIRKSTHPKVNAKWRAEWNAYVRRWELERDSYADWGSRLFLSAANARLSSFQAHYLWWARDFEKRTSSSGSSTTTKTPPVPRKQPAKRTDMADSLIPGEMWWIIGAAAVAYAMSRRG